jgi:hypothetical protein
MSDPNPLASAIDPIASAMAAASQSLRDTAKWLVGGVAATAAGVFAGSSLTALGSLDWATNAPRLAMAGTGILLGFAGLGFIFASAIQVLTRESKTFFEIATPSPGENKEIKALRDELFKRYGGELPRNASTFADYMLLVDDAVKRRNADPENPDPKDTALITRIARDTELIARAARDNRVWSPDASFLFVRARFNTLVGRLWWATLFAIVGFGLFAWAANPPKPQSTSPDCSKTTQAGTL